MSKVCEEFGCLPSDAAREIEHDPEHLAMRILPFRAYARALRTFDAAKKKADLPTDDPLIEEVQVQEFERVRRLMKEGA